MQKSQEGMTLLGAFSVAEALPEDMRVTVFAPTDEAFLAALQDLQADSGAAAGAEEIATVC